MEKFTKSKLVAQIAITSFVAALAIVGVAYATTIGTNILTTGTLTVDTDTLYVDATNNKVGVGTTTPFATLSIDTDTGINPFVIGSSTAGTFLTVDTSGNLIVDTNTLYVDAVNNRVGIGTSSPSMPLSITYAGTQAMIGYNATNYATLAVSSGGDTTIVSSGGDISFSDENLVTTGTLASGALTVTGAEIITTNLTVDTNTLYVDATNDKVGVGTTTPFATLSIDTDTGINPFVIGSSTAGTFLTVDTSGNLIVDTNTLYVDAVNNRIGIGTSSPSMPLSITYAGTQAMIGYNATNYATLSVSSGGDLTIVPSGGDATITGTLAVTGLLTATGGITLQNAATISNPSTGVISLGGAVNIAGYATTTAAGIIMPTQQYTTNAGCTSATVGGLTFNASKQILCVCTGTTWKAATSTTAVDCF